MLNSKTKTSYNAITKRNNQIFQDLEYYLEFCKEFGYFYDEADLNSPRSYIYRQFQKYTQGKFTRSMWELDAYHQ
jgi:hypothetical protein